MTEAAIVVEGLGKRYRIGEQIQYRVLRDSITNVLYAPARLVASLLTGKRRSNHHKPAEDIWALRDVSFSVEPGEVVGVIGRNGAGKSTLLKILTRITEPTEGSAQIRGRIGSLLEVGTGFHPELTGRDNIFLNGTILGMRQAEIRRKFDEIVEFSGIQRFIDTPVKRYSSGMYVRLAFAVAAHLEPDVMLVDEVLSVGDAAFQKKCLGKISEVTSHGRTVLFVSHNMSAIRQLCPTSIWLEDGRIAAHGPSSEVIDRYLLTINQRIGTAETTFDVHPDRDFQVLSARLVDESGTVRDSFEVSEPPIIELTCEVREQIPGLYGYLAFSRTDGTVVFEGDSQDVNPNPLDNLVVGRHLVRIGIPPLTLGHGTYSIYLSFASIFAAADSRVHSPRELGTFTLDDFTTPRGNRRAGFFSTPLTVEVEPLP